MDPKERCSENIRVRLLPSSSEHETASVEMLPNPQASLTGDSRTCCPRARSEHKVLADARAISPLQLSFRKAPFSKRFLSAALRRRVGVFKFLRFQERFQNSPFSCRTSVDGRKNRRNKMSSNSSCVLWTRSKPNKAGMFQAFSIHNIDHQGQNYT